MKTSFLNNELWILTIGGAFQRANIYERNVKEKIKNEFKESLRAKVVELAAKYKESIGDEQHVNNIQTIIQSCTHRILQGGQLRFGIAQKLFNLYLKYEWCRGNILMPPHCPIDRIVLSELNKYPIDNWTQLNDSEKYLNLINELRSKAQGRSLAEWELEIFNRRANKMIQQSK
jgi:hypothetical protein